MQLSEFEAHQSAEIQALFERTFADAEGPAEIELVSDLMGDTGPTCADVPAGAPRCVTMFDDPAYG